MDFLESNWKNPDRGIWEVRGPDQHFTHSKVMAWMAMDRAVKEAANYGMLGDSDRWRGIAQEIHADICQKAYNPELGSFVQAYGSRTLDASQLVMPLVGFLPIDDPRIEGTIKAIESKLMKNGFLLRYLTEETHDGLPGSEGAFLACSFWYVNVLCRQKRITEARKMFERLLSIQNDVGLLAEEYDPVLKRQVGNFPQAFSHVTLIYAAQAIDRTIRLASERAEAA